MAVTTINIDAVEAGGASARKQIASQEDMLARLDGVINSMQTAWDSPTQDVYAERFRETMRRIRTFNDGMTKSVANMLGFAHDCARVDRETADALRGVSW